jgi:HAD superfamily hydrolase (TIGR01509 family)
MVIKKRNDILKKNLINKPFIKGVIFDMDGTIINSEPVHILAEKTVCEKYKIPIKKEDWDYFKGRSAIDNFSWLIKKYKVNNISSEKLVDEKRKIFFKNILSINLFDNTINILKWLKKNNYKISLATSSPLIVQKKIFKFFNLNNYFDSVVTLDNVKKGKPNPELFSLAIKSLSLKKNECIVVEDAENGIIAAKKAGALALGVARNRKQKIFLKDSDYIINDLIKIKDIILFVNGGHFKIY